MRPGGIPVLPIAPVESTGGGAVAAPGASGLGDATSAGAKGSRAAASTTGEAPTVEELLEEGLYRAGASPVHLAIRGTPAADSVRCAWRGVARTAEQRAGAIRFWLRLAATDPIPDAVYLETLFAVVLDTLASDYRETAKANFLAIARGGESMEYLFLTCFADYAVTNFLLGTGTTPTTVTVANDRMGEAASYELYVREHDTGTYGTEALKTRGDYEAGLQAQVVAAETALSAEIGGREAVVFLAPMGAHNAIGFEAWQAVASWAVVTDDDDVVQAIRDDTPEGDPEHTQTLANLTSRITTAAAADGQATTRVTTVGGLQTHYRTTLLAYADITPGDGATTTFTPKQPPAAPTCTNGTVFANPSANRELVKDCEALLAAKGHPAGHGHAQLEHRHGDEQLDRRHDRGHADAGDGGEPGDAGALAQAPHLARARLGTRHPLGGHPNGDPGQSPPPRVPPPAARGRQATQADAHRLHAQAPRPRQRPLPTPDHV